VPVNYYVVYVSNRGFVQRGDGIVTYCDEPFNAERHSTKELAEAGQVGHSRSMGGSGFKGKVTPITF
jgi:hypothetical protein